MQLTDNSSSIMRCCIRDPSFLSLSAHSLPVAVMRPLLCALAATALLLSLLAAHTDAGTALAAAAPTVPLHFVSCGPSDAQALFVPAQFLSSNATGAAGQSLSMAVRGELRTAVTGGAYSLLVTSARDGATSAPTMLAQSFGSLGSLFTSPPLPVQPGADVELAFDFVVPDESKLTTQDHTLQLQLQLSDDTQRALLCVFVDLPLDPLPPPAPEPPVVPKKALGYVCALISVLFFGTNFLPVKQFDTQDGVFFQWIMCLGIWLVGLVVQLIRNAAFEPFAMIGGMCWCFGNMASVPVIQCVGLAVGMCVWCTSSLIMGWSAGRFGLLGVHAQAVASEGMNYAGLILCVISMGLMFMVKSVKDEQAAAGDDHHGHTKALLDDSVNLSASGLLESGSANGASAPFRLSQISSYNASPVPTAKEAEAEMNWTERLSPRTRRALGIGLAVFAGCLYGLALNPSQYLMDSGKGASKHGIDYVFSHICGILLTSTAYMVAYAVYKRNAPMVPSHIVLPGLASGIGWAIAQASWFVANDQIKFVGTFPIVSTGPGIVATLCAIVFYREIQGMRNYLILACAALVTLTGVLLIAFSLPEGA